MEKRWIYVFVLFDLALISAVVVYFTWESREDMIKKEIEQANYCEVVADCQQVALSKCPFGCFIHVNKNEAGRIEGLLNEFQSNCEYSCLEMKGVDCVNNTCQVLH